jgi:hypothetical protein
MVAASFALAAGAKVLEAAIAHALGKKISNLVSDVAADVMGDQTPSALKTEEQPTYRPSMRLTRR